MYDVKQGWGPLCKFLGVPVPQTPFPHKNVRGAIIDEMMAKEPLMIRAKREIAVSFSLIAVLVGFGMYKFTPKFLELFSSLTRFIIR